MNSMLKQIREKYPYPSRLPHGDESWGDESYCVGGALCQFVGNGIEFPTVSMLANVLCAVNKNLSDEKGGEYAFKIIMENQAGNFDSAWDVLGDALSYGEA
jgi:hypothetical protein